MRTSENAVVEHYQEALAHGRLELPHCRACGRLVAYPRARCPFCMSDDLGWRTLSGRGGIYSYTVNRRGTGPYRGADPFVIAYVEIEEGPRLLCQIRADPDRVAIGSPVRLIATDPELPLTFELDAHD